MGNKTNISDVQTDFERFNERHREGHTEPIHNGYVKWIIIIACIIVAAAVIIIPIVISENRTDHLSLPEDINKITIYKEGTAGTTFSYTDEEKIDRVLEYLNSLKLKSTTRTPYGPQEFYTGGWQISAFSAGEKYGLELVGNKYLQDPDGVWWEITSAEAEQFEELLKE